MDRQLPVLSLVSARWSLQVLSHAHSSIAAARPPDGQTSRLALAGLLPTVQVPTSRQPTGPMGEPGSSQRGVGIEMH